MTNDHSTNSRNVQQNIKFWPHKASYLDFGDIDFICRYCSTSF